MHMLHKAHVLQNRSGVREANRGVGGMGGTCRSKKEHYLVSALGKCTCLTLGLIHMYCIIFPEVGEMPTNTPSSSYMYVCINAFSTQIIFVQVQCI